MGLILPVALAFIALAIPIIIFYMLRLRRQPIKVSSLLLWQRVLQDHQANAPWQRLRRNLLLLLQLLLLALLVLALARPYWLVEAKVQGNVIIVLDASLSMQATDINPTRFEAAKTEASSIIRSLKPGDSVSLILAADLPSPLLTGDASSDRGALETALTDASPAFASTDWEATLALVAASATSQPNSTVVILSDGAIPSNLAPLPVPVQWINVGESTNNQAIVALASREGRNGAELFVRVINFANDPVERLIEIRADGQLFDARKLNLAAYPKGEINLTFSNLPTEATNIEARLAENDLLMIDNIAQTIRSTLGGRVLLVGPGNLFLERGFSLLPGLSVFQATPDNLPTETAFDLVIYDRTAPESLAENASNFLFIAPPTDTPLFSVQGIFTNTTLSGISAVDKNHPLTNFVDFSNLHVAQAQKVVPPLWAKSLLNAGGGSLLLAGQTEGQRVAILTFDLLKSDLPLQIDFPILVANLSQWLLGQASFTDPTNTTISPEQAQNPLDAAESNIRPNQAQIEGRQPAEGGDDNTIEGQQEFWWLLAILALGVLFWEWWVYWRGGGG